MGLDEAIAPTPGARQPGRLVLVPNALDLGSGHLADLRACLPERAIERAAGLEYWAVENAKSARAFLKRVEAITALALPLQAMNIVELPRAAKGSAGTLESLETWLPLLAPAHEGHDIGLLCEAGMPAIADPGSALVRAAHELGIVVEPWPGPSSLMLALAASGLDGQHFAFVGYLPVQAVERAARIRELDALSRRLRQTQIAIETPYRNAALLQALVEHLSPQTRLAVACALTLPGGWCRTQRVAQWRQRKPAVTFAKDQPAVFAWLA